MHKKKLFCVNFSWNFFHTIFTPQANIGTKEPGNSTTNTAKITPFFYTRRKKIVKYRSIIWSIEWWIVENGLAAILTPKSNSAFYPYYGRTLLDRNTSAIVKLMDAILGCMENEPASLDRMYLADVCWPPRLQNPKQMQLQRRHPFFLLQKRGRWVILWYCASQSIVFLL